MKIIVAGQDCAVRLGPTIREQAQKSERDPRCAFLPRHLSALSLSDAGDSADYYRRLIGLIRYKNHVDTLPFDIPHRPTFLGKCMGRVRAFLWKLLRYQHDRMAFRQNLINSNVTSAIEFQHQEILKLEKRLEQLERAER